MAGQFVFLIKGWQLLDTIQKSELKKNLENILYKCNNQSKSENRVKNAIIFWKLGLKYENMIVILFRSASASTDKR